jgi:hypothetical protein
MNPANPSPEAGRMRYRKLRIAWSVGCGITCVLLILLWVRSYRVIDVVDWTTSTRITFVSEIGIIQVSRSKSSAIDARTWKWHTLTDFMGAFPRTWSFNSSRDGFRFSFPHRLPIAVFATLAAAPWIRQLNWRFSLRTLLIATTLVGAILGAIVYAAK